MIAIGCREILTVAHSHLSQTFALANEFKEGDLNFGGTRDDHVRRVARDALAAVSLGDIARADFGEGQVTEVLHRSLDQRLAGKVAHLTVAELRRILLSSQGASWIEAQCDSSCCQQPTFRLALDYFQSIRTNLSFTA